MTATELTRDHCLEDNNTPLDEAERVSRAGGTVLQSVDGLWRVARRQVHAHTVAPVAAPTSLMSLKHGWMTPRASEARQEESLEQPLKSAPPRGAGQGGLQVTRSYGDGPLYPGVVATPTVSRPPLRLEFPRDQTFLLASDGLFDVIGPSSALRWLRATLGLSASALTLSTLAAPATSVFSWCAFLVGT